MSKGSPILVSMKRKQYPNYQKAYRSAHAKEYTAYQKAYRAKIAAAKRLLWFSVEDDKPIKGDHPFKL